jgi:uncharacterized protein with NRDE domain
MCTLVFGFGVVAPGTLVLATNRDEDPARGSEAPQALRRSPLVLGGRDVVAGGTWLALRPGRAVAGGGDDAPPSASLLLNRFDPEPGKAGRRSRGLLTLDVAAAEDPRERARMEAASGRYAPCSLVWLSQDEAWLLALRAGQAPELQPIAPGWHALTHFELDDPTDARATWLLAQLAAWRPESLSEARARLESLIASHGGDGAPPICLHGGRAPTVSAASLVLAHGAVSYRHAQGPPCVTPFTDQAALLAAD